MDQIDRKEFGRSLTGDVKLTSDTEQGRMKSADGTEGGGNE